MSFKWLTKQRLQRALSQSDIVDARHIPIKSPMRVRVPILRKKDIDALIRKARKKASTQPTVNVSFALHGEVEKGKQRDTYDELIKSLRSMGVI